MPRAAQYTLLVGVTVAAQRESASGYGSSHGERSEGAGDVVGQLARIIHLNAHAVLATSGGSACCSAPRLPFRSCDVQQGRGSLNPIGA